MVRCGLIFLLYSIGCLTQNTNGKVQLNFLNVIGTPNTNHLTMTVNLRNLTGHTIVDVDSTLITNLGKTILLLIELQTQNEMSGYETLFKSDNIDLCAAFETAKEHPLAVPFLQNIEKHGNIPQSCPVSKGHYFLKGFYINEDLLPSFTPSGNFRVKFAVSFLTVNNATEDLLSMQWDAEVINNNTSLE